ncbi:hypothetical protein M2451_000115 [Dysgonomonas sp. PFB1-18]|uniref:hypothetical protein n=1 Tax=unclassified Dysgonomonas TaxID=2630389 RepID=UPI0024738B35|nr:MULTISPECIES: hypothetical protein [unclassified Dysgonomonas]MDH6307666.1 hypothetical protein [Dysgonomonas sp. PF1-14]MDH6337584.1 hypothetical protein [Dysgonomonas sp. PF1-16]MDH6378808.1 hypothetical protein [Dysgonomonas sp. PFB1-18]MDH6396443.1 hypothetical protein [Dysgonomonas sp. PF1-23]
MKKCLIAILVLLLAFPMLMNSQNQLALEDISGRWIEWARIEGDSVRLSGDFADTYIFRDNMVFHKGEASEGVILFNVTGKYTIEGDSVKVFYRDYLNKRASRQPAKQLILKILSKSKDELRVAVIDYDYEYKMILKR